MKSLMILFHRLLEESGSWCGVSTDLDSKTAQARFEHEGLSFLTISLANFGRDLQKSLDQGFTSPTLFAGFRFRGGTPLFLGGFLDLVFDRGTGRLLDMPSIDSIRCLRQLTLAFAKIKIDCTDARVAKAVRAYIECEQQIRVSDKSLSSDEFNAFTRIGGLLFSQFFSDIDLKIYNKEILPKHGSGSTADRVHGNAKYLSRNWTVRLENVFPSGEFLYANWRHYLQSPPNLLEPGQEIPARVTTVPKTQKTPRIIAMEPVCMQYMQQAILEAMTERVQGDNLLRSLIGWNDQTPNQRMALRGSIDGSLATLDLSEASDRVSYQHVRGLIANHPHLLDAVDACRSRKADIPGYGVKRLAKFASMGSALCFPFESMVFITLVFLGIEKVLNRRLTIKDIKSLIGQVRTYGDDIIVPTRFAHSVVDTLHLFGYKVNQSKSFWTGKFRESCGREYYDGVDVSIVKIRSVFPEQRRNAPEIISTVATRNLLYKAGYWNSCRFIDQLIERVIPFPAVGDDSPILGRYSFSGFDTQGWSNELQHPLVKGALVRNKIPVNRLDDYSALLKWFLKRGEEPFIDRHHLERSGRPSRVYIMTGRARPF